MSNSHTHPKAMKRLLTLLLTVAAMAATAGGHIETFTLRSEILQSGKSCTVYLPDGYDRDTTRRYPVLYLLHGASGYHGDWVEKGNMYQIAEEAIAAGRALPMVVVMPDASGTGPHYMGDHMGYFDVCRDGPTNASSSRNSCPPWSSATASAATSATGRSQAFRWAAAVRPYMLFGIRSSSRRPAR